MTIISSRPLRPIVLLSYLSVFGWAQSVGAADTDSEKPNIVVILADDLGWNCVGYHNEEFKTPNIDSIAADGVELDRFYVAPMCTPTRAGFMTGRFPIRFGCARAVIPPYRDFGLPNAETTIAEMLAECGYPNRSVFGKWHLGHRRAKWHPLNQGFTHFHGHYNGAIDYFALTRENQRDWHVDYDPIDEQGYATDLIADAASKWIGQTARSESPYFCYVPFNAPHSPFQAPDDAIGKYGVAAKTRGEKNREIYKAMVGRMDEGIGKILSAIDATGEADNTLVWFFSDNGGVKSLREVNMPLRGAKLTVDEGGIRVPACVRWPNVISSGMKSDVVCGYVDLLPTLVAAAGRKASDFVDQTLDGLDISSALINQDETQRMSTRVWFSYHGQSGSEEHLAVTKDGWKLSVVGPQTKQASELQIENHEVRLTHLDADLSEINNLKSEFPERVQTLAQLLFQHWSLQPARGVPQYRNGRDGFIAPKQWALNQRFPERLMGQHKQPDR